MTPEMSVGRRVKTKEPIDVCHCWCETLVLSVLQVCKFEPSLYVGDGAARVHFQPCDRECFHLNYGGLMTFFAHTFVDFGSNGFLDNTCETDPLSVWCLCRAYWGHSLCSTSFVSLDMGHVGDKGLGSRLGSDCALTFWPSLPVLIGVEDTNPDLEAFCSHGCLLDH